MKLDAILENHEYEPPNPTDSEVQQAKQRFKALVAAGTLYHTTRDSSTAEILKLGFRAQSFFSFGKPNLIADKSGWTVLKVNGAEVADSVYPDPEHMYASRWIRDLLDVEGWSDITFARVTGMIPKDTLPWIFFGIKKKITPGFWLVCDKPIPANLIARA